MDAGAEYGHIGDGGAAAAARVGTALAPVGRPMNRAIFLTRLQRAGGALLLPALLAASGCQRGGDDQPSGSAPAALLSPVAESAPLDAKLEHLQAELEAALAGEMDDRAYQRLIRAEAITDRLLEVPPPIGWLAASYDVESYLRQIQALADRIEAQIRRGGRPQAIRGDTEALHAMVVELRTAIAQPGGREPTRYESLLPTLREDLQRLRGR
jgi:hypothetical protein